MMRLWAKALSFFAPKRNAKPVVTARLFDSEPEPDLPQTFVACRCGHLNPIHAVECEQCGAPHPRHLAQLVRCASCGDEDGGPWLVRNGRTICERCNDEAVA